MRCELQLTWVGAQKEEGAPQGWDRWEEFSWSFNQVPEAECGLMQECKPHGSHGHRGHAPAQASSPYTFTGFSWGRLRGGEGARQNPPVGWAGEGQPHLQLCPHYRQELQFSAGGGEAEQTLPLPLGDKKPQGRREGKGRLSTPGWGAGSHPGSEPLETVYFPERRDTEKAPLPRPGDAAPTQDWVCTRTTEKALDSPLGLAGTMQQAWQSVMGRRKCVKEIHAEAWVNMRGVTKKREGTEKNSLATNL